MLHCISAYHDFHFFFQCSTASPRPRNTRRHDRATAAPASHTASSNYPNASHQAAYYDSPRVPPTVIRSTDGEHGYKHNQYELRQAQKHDKKMYRETIGEGRPPNVTVTMNPDGTTNFPIQTHLPRSAISSNTRGSSADARSCPPPPYSQHKPQSCKEDTDSCICGLPQHSDICLQNAHRRGSCPSYTSHRSEPPSYEMAVSNDNVAPPTDRSTLPSSQLL